MNIHFMHKLGANTKSIKTNSLSVALISVYAGYVSITGVFVFEHLQKSLNQLFSIRTPMHKRCLRKQKKDHNLL